MRTIIALFTGLLLTALGVYFGQRPEPILITRPSWYVREGAWATSWLWFVGHATDDGSEISFFSNARNVGSESDRIRRMVEEERIRQIIAEELDRRQKLPSNAPQTPNTTTTSPHTSPTPEVFRRRFSSQPDSSSYVAVTQPQLSMWDRLYFAGNRLFDHLFNDPKNLLLPLFFGTIYYLVMLAGIFTGSVYDGLGSTDTKRSSA